MHDREAVQALLNALILLWILGLAAVMFGRGNAYVEGTRRTIERIPMVAARAAWRLARRFARWLGKKLMELIKYIGARLIERIRRW